MDPKLQPEMSKERVNSMLSQFSHTQQLVIFTAAHFLMNSSLVVVDDGVAFFSFFLFFPPSVQS